ncbi:MAG: hypothetical protein JWL72_895 [Ilumatobacteraceae bacterium]|nr:hypothetical protein [Ilumatobacteraceae bacterium]
MDIDQLSPIADLLLFGGSRTGDYSRRFHDEFGQPPSAAAKTHHLRSIVQARASAAVGYKLNPRYSEQGRVEIEDLASDRRYLLRSHGALSIEQAKNSNALFDSTEYIVSDVIMVPFRFQAAGLDLSVVATKHAAGRFRLEPTGPVTFIGTWPYTTLDGPFGQGAADTFDDLFDIEDFGLGGE